MKMTLMVLFGIVFPTLLIFWWACMMSWHLVKYAVTSSYRYVKKLHGTNIS